REWFLNEEMGTRSSGFQCEWNVKGGWIRHHNCQRPTSEGSRQIMIDGKRLQLRIGQRRAACTKETHAGPAKCAQAGQVTPANRSQAGDQNLAHGTIFSRGR